MKAVNSHKYKFFFTLRTRTAWKNMLNRCRNGKTYTKKGIKVCERWNDFKNFVDDMGQAPEGLCLDRINTLGDYSPDNCRWITQKENTRNTVRNHMINGKCLTDVAAEIGIHPATLHDRLKRNSPRGFSPNTSKKIAVLCVETGAIYPSLKEAAKAIGRSACTITVCCKNPSLTSGGYHWQKVKNVSS